MALLIKILCFLFVLKFAHGQSDCYCVLEDSDKYIGTYKWNCMDHALIEVPHQCFQETSANVTELVLTSNLLSYIQAEDFADLPSLKALYLDSNEIVSFDVAGLTGVDALEILNLSQNSDLVLPYEFLTSTTTLKELYLVSTHLGNLPNLETLTHLTTLDARSCDLPSLPRPLFGQIEDSDFYINLFANNFVDVAADILLPIPDYATVNLDYSVIIWAVDEYEHYDVVNKNWNINLDIDEAIKVCDYDGTPTDTTMC